MNVHYLLCDEATGAVKQFGGPLPEEQVRLASRPGLMAVAVDGEAITVQEVAGQLVPTVNMDGVRRFISRRIDAEAGAARLRYITSAPGQELTYQRKEAEARAWSADADIADFPFLAAEAAARDIPIDAVAALIVAASEAWTRIGSRIEGTRIGAKVAIADAATILDILAAATVDWAAIEAASV